MRMLQQPDKIIILYPGAQVPRVRINDLIRPGEPSLVWGSAAITQAICWW